MRVDQLVKRIDAGAHGLAADHDLERLHRPGHAARYLRAEGFPHRLERLRVFYRRRAKHLASAIRRELPGWRFNFPEGGFALWLEPDAPDCRGGELGLLEAAIDEGVSFDPGSSFLPDRSPHPLALRLCYSALDPKDLAEGARRLARAWRRVEQPVS